MEHHRVRRQHKEPPHSSGWPVPTPELLPATPNPGTAGAEGLAAAKVREKRVRASTDGRRTHLAKVDVNGILEELRGFHAPLLNGEDAHGFDARFQLDHAGVLVLRGQSGTRCQKRQ